MTSLIRADFGELNINNLSVIHDRVENYLPNNLYNIIISRAFTNLAKFIMSTNHLIEPCGKWLAMKGVYPYDELENLPATYQFKKIFSLKLPI